MSRVVGEETGTAARATATTRERIEVPGACVEAVYRPTCVADLATLLAERHARSESVLVCGGRTRLAEANRAGGLSAALSLDALAGIDVFEPDEGVVHALAGTPIHTLRAAVAAEGWELPLDPPGRSATVGGTIASAAMGPRSHVFGRVADAVLGLELVGADGTVSKCGGRVVKNVTGYDLAKLYTGSFGSLAVVTGAWLRLRPQPARRAVLRGRVPRDRESFERMRGLAKLASVRAFVWSESPASREAELEIELAASELAVAQDRRTLEQACSLSAVGLDAVDRLRDARAREASREPIGLRARVLASRLDEMRQAIVTSDLAVSIDVGLGVLTARGALGSPVALARLREKADVYGGHATFEWLPPAGFEALDAFGEQPGTRTFAAALKQRFDPRRILNPGRFVAGT